MAQGERWMEEVLGPEWEGSQELPPMVQAVMEAWRTERQKRIAAEEELLFYKASADAMPNPIFIKDEDLRFVFFNRAYREFFGLAEGEGIGSQVGDLPHLSPEERKRFQEEDMSLLRDLSSAQYDFVYQSDRLGEVKALYWSKGFSVDWTGQRGLIGEIVDISKERKVQSELVQNIRDLEMRIRDARKAFYTDPLTKLYNRNILDEVPSFIQTAEELGQPICLLLIDVDYYKSINDRYGHLFGDDVLQRFADVMKQTFRQKDIAIRYGGDEFMMLLPGAALPPARSIAERFREAVCRSLPLPEGGSVTPSIGIAQWKPEDDLQSFIARADEALYEAKKAGRNCVAVKE